MIKICGILLCLFRVIFLLILNELLRTGVVIGIRVLCCLFFAHLLLQFLLRLFSGFLVLSDILPMFIVVHVLIIDEFQFIQILLKAKNHISSFYSILELIVAFKFLRKKIFLIRTFYWHYFVSTEETRTRTFFGADNSPTSDTIVD